MTSSPDHASVSADTVTADDPDLAAQAQAQAIREQLKRRINAYTHPSRLINQIGLADARCITSTRALARLIGRSPKVLTVIRAELRNAFEMDPDHLLFTEPKPPAVPRKVDCLTDRALALLVLPTVVINVNQFTTLSVKDEPNRRLPYTPLEALRRVIALRLFERLAHAVSVYWDALAQGSWLTRRERWVELYKALFADRAFMARQLEPLSSAALDMVQALIEAPTAEARQRAGGAWATLQVGQLLWPGTPAVAIPGALHLYREGDPSEAPHVVYLPGEGCNFYEYPSYAALQDGLLVLDRSRFHALWQCLPLSRRNDLCRPTALSAAHRFVRGLPLMDDALTLCAQAMLTGQWSNELACAVKINDAHVFSEQRPRPQPLDAAPFLAQVEGARRQLVGGARLGVIGDQLLNWDRQRRGAEIIFASTASGLALRTAEHQVKRYEKALVALLVPDDPSADTLAYQVIVALVSQLKAYAEVLKTLMRDGQPRLLDLAFWAERPDGAGTPRRVSLFMRTQTEALRCEVELQHRLKLISTAHRDLMIDVVEHPSRTQRLGSQTQVLSIAVGSEPDAFYALHNVWVVTTAAAVRRPARQLPVVVYAFGSEGGVKAFAGLDALTQSLQASLSSLDDSVLWGCVEHDKRRDLRAHAARGTLGVRYVEIQGKPALVALKKLLGCYDRLKRSREDITRIFSEVTDAELSRSLLMVALEEQLNIPLNTALSQALANIELLRAAASEARKLPTWLAHATRAQRRTFKRLLRLYLGSAFAFKGRLGQRLPDLDTFARRALIARLRQDGFFPLLDIDQPLIDMPDDVHGAFCGWTSGCTVGDRNIVLTPTAARTTFSLLQLTLHNLDPLAPWTAWRFNRARYLQPEWKQRLNADYLTRMVSSLDIGGQYDTAINRVFYPRIEADRALSNGRIRELLNRALRAGVEYHLFCATQQGLTATAQSVFKTAMAARTRQDLSNNQHQLQLYVVHLVGHTMQHDRYVAGIVVVHDRRSELCLVYWPDAPSSLVLTEYGSLQRAHAELNRIGALPDNVKALARQVAPGWAFEAIPQPAEGGGAHVQAGKTLKAIPAFFMAKGIWRGIEFVRSFSIKHLEPAAVLEEIEAQTLEQIASDPQDWLGFVATPHSNAEALLYHASVQDLQRRTQAASHSGKALASYRTRRLGEQGDTRARAVVGFFSPLYGMFNDFYELLRVSRSYHRFGDPHDAVDLGFMSAFMAIDLLLNLIPGPKKVGRAGAGIARPMLRGLLGRIQRLRMAVRSGVSRTAPSPVTQLKALERFKIKGVPEGAVALKGPDESGVYVKNGEPFVADDTHHYPLYRRGNEPVFRLKNTQVPGQDELILHLHQPKEWSLGADAPQPVAGTSSGVLNPWRAPAPPPPPDWWPATARVATEDAIRQSSATSSHWSNWRTSLQSPDATSPVPEVFHITSDTRGFPHNVLRVAPPNTGVMDPMSGYYRMLPQGDQAPLDGIVFIHRNEPMVSLASFDIERWTSVDILEQPFPVTRSPAGEWLVHAPLFDKPLPESVGAVFPSMTLSSRQFTAARLIELAGPSRPATATHLLNIRATLDKWSPPAPARAGQTDDLLRMLRSTERGKRTFHVGFDGKAPGFTRVDFKVTDLDPALRSGGREMGPQRDIAQCAAIKRVLEQQGFSVEALLVRHGNKTTRELFVTHPLSGSNRVYYVSVHWLELGSIKLERRLTDRWFNIAITNNPTSVAFAAVKSAMRDKRLFRIVAGVQWPTAGEALPSVYFAKVSPS